MLQGRVIVVTGAGRGLGKSYAAALASAGASVVVNDVDGEAAGAVVDEIEAGGGQAVAHVAPVGEADVADDLVRLAVSTYGRLDAMVPNAGVLRDSTIARMTDEAFDAVVATHLRGAFTCARSAFARFREQGDGGRLILIGSPAGQRASFGQTNYSSAKSGIVGMTRTLAAEGRRYGIAVNAIVPTALTRMMATIPQFTELVASVEAGGVVPDELRAQGIGTPDDVAPIVVFLAGLDESVTGQVIGMGGDRLSLWSHPQEVQVSVRQGGWTVETLTDEFTGVFSAKLQDFSLEGAVAEAATS